MTGKKVRSRGASSESIFNKGSEIGDLVADIRKSMGEHTVSTGSGSLGFNHIETGIFVIDYATFGGLQEGRVAQAYGHEGTGKTTLALRVCAAAQRKYTDKAVVIIDAEGTLDFNWAAQNGLDQARALHVLPDSGEQAVDVLEAMMRAQEVSTIVVDSIPAIVPQKVINNSAEDDTMAAQARLIGKACSKILAASIVERKRGHFPTIIFINQWRTKLGVMFGDPRSLPGGVQPRYLSSLMIETKKKKAVMGDDEYGNKTVHYNEHAFKIDKLKGGSSIREGEFELVCHSDFGMPAGTINDFKTVGVYGKRMGLITGGGSSWKIDGVNSKFSRLSEIEDFFKDNRDEFLGLQRKIISMKRISVGLPALPPDGYLLGYA